MGTLLCISIKLEVSIAFMPAGLAPNKIKGNQTPLSNYFYFICFLIDKPVKSEQENRPNNI